MHRFVVLAVAAAAVAAIAHAQEESPLPKPAAKIAGGGNPNSFAIGGTRRIAAASHSHYVGEISPYLKKQMELEAEKKRNQPRTVLSVFTRSASIRSPWFVPRARKTPEQRMSELSAASIPIHVRKPTFRTAHFF